MYLLKPPYSKGNFVENLQTTVRTLKEKCGYVPKTAFKRPGSSTSLKKVVWNSKEPYFEMDIEADEVVVIDEPNSTSANFNL